VSIVPNPLVEESHRQIRQAWRYFATHLPGGGVVSEQGLIITDGRSALPFMNAAFLSEPVSDEADLRRRIELAAAHFRRQGLHWVFMPADDQLSPDLVPRLTEIAAAAGLQYMMPMTGMVATALQAPRRALPAIEVRPVGDDETRRAVADINGEGYAMPGDLMHAATGVVDVWTDMIGMVGYVDGEAVATASVTPVDGVAYVCLVATRPGHQRKGYAEAVMRRALDDARRAWGIERTVLHATPAGHPVYSRMGYDDTNRFHVLVGE
jgi:GNAT superfamily N-acetyltransferase